MKGIFLIAKYTQRPKNPNMTHLKGYMQDSNNWQWDEQVQVANKVRTKDITNAQVILNLVDGEVVRNGLSNNRDFPALFKHFYKDAVKAINPNLELVVATDEEVKAE
jgi:hypothetical protein